MGFTIETSVSALTVFAQGLLSFFSPCVLPLIPLYVSYLAGGASTVDEKGNRHYPKGKILTNTLFFVLGISFAFFLLGLGFTAVGRFFCNNRVWFARLSGIIMILFGLYQLGVFGASSLLGRERRLPISLKEGKIGPLAALLMGFGFSFAWTPCVGPVLGSVLLMAGTAGNAGRGFFLIGVYTLGFVMPFLGVGLFTGGVLDFFKKYQSVVRYTVKIGGILLILMGLMTLTGFMNGITGYLSTMAPDTASMETQVEERVAADDAGASTEVTGEGTEVTGEGTQAAGEQEKGQTVAAPGFTLLDQYGEEHILSDYAGKTVFLNFWATWCPPCRGEMPDIQALYEKYGNNEGDVIVLGLAAPSYGREGSLEDVKTFLADNEYSFPVVMDMDGSIVAQYGISAYPTTFMIDRDGNIFGYAQGALTGDIMENIVEQTIAGKR